MNRVRRDHVSKKSTDVTKNRRQRVNTRRTISRFLEKILEVERSFFKLFKNEKSFKKDFKELWFTWISGLLDYY